jgi:hypothetical protein
LVEIFVSSANMLAEDEVRQFGRSFIYIIRKEVAQD